jgi:hypothetical protein
MTQLVGHRAQLLIFSLDRSEAHRSGWTERSVGIYPVCETHRIPLGLIEGPQPRLVI